MAAAGASAVQLKFQVTLELPDADGRTKREIGRQVRRFMLALSAELIRASVRLEDDGDGDAEDENGNDATKSG